MGRGFLLVAAVLLVTSGLSLLAPPAAAADAKPLEFGLPRPMVGEGVVQVDDALYVLGGRFSDYTLSDAIVRIDLATGENRTAARFPDVSIAPGSPQRYAGAAAAFNGKIYYFGGATTVQGSVGGTSTTVPKPIPDIVVYDPSRPVSALPGNENPRILPTKLEPGAWGMGVAVIGSSAYLFGGFTLDLTVPVVVKRHDWVLRFDFNTETLTTLPQRLPYEVQDAATVYLTAPTGKVYLFGGLATNGTNNECPGYYVTNEETNEQEYYTPPLCLTNTIIRWDPTLGESEIIEQKLPFRVQYMQSGVVRGGRAFLLGGVLVDQSSSSAILEWNPASTTPLRTLVPTLSPGVFGAGTVSDGSTITLLGGRTAKPRNEDDQLLATIVRFDPNPTPPRPPLGLVAERTQASIRLTWQPPTYDGDSPVTGYRVLRTDAAGVETPLTPQPIAGLTFDDTATRPGANYTYRVIARNSIGESQPAVVSTATATTVPGAVLRFTAYPGNGEAILRWDAPTETGGLEVTGYRVYRDGADRPVASLAAGQTSYADKGLENGVEHVYVVRAVNSKGEGAASPALRVTPAPVPDAPTSVTAQANGDDETAAGIVVRWFAPATGVDRFLVLRGTTRETISTEVGNVTASQTEFTDTAVLHGRTYHYAVRSLSTTGVSPPSEPVSVSLVDVPGAPANVRATGLEGAIQVAWDVPLDLGDASPEAITYVVTRYAPGSTRGIIVSPPDLKEKSFTDRTATPGLTYTYNVMTQNPRRSDPSASVTAVALVVSNKVPVGALSALPAIAFAGDPVTLDASQSSDPDGAIVEYAFNFGDGSDIVRSPSATATHRYQANGSYSATVVVTDDRGNVSEPVSARVIVGELVATETPDTGVGTPPTRTTTSGSDRPGSGTGSLIPGPAPVLVALAAAGAALLARRHLRR